MILATELECLQQLHRDGTLSDTEFARAEAVALGKLMARFNTAGRQ